MSRWRNGNSISPEADPHALGRWGEDKAARHLKSQGYKILYRNYRAPHGGEVDIVCRHKPTSTLVFTEVKTRMNEEFGRPFDAVNEKKRRLIIRGALTWLKMLDYPDIRFRFDVVEIIVQPEFECRIIEDAFHLPDEYIV
ncbi:MAG: YraN family protein [Chthoniobacterales bacterium]